MIVSVATPTILYGHVEDLKYVLQYLLDRVLDGEDISAITKGAKKRANGSLVFECDLCNWKSKFSSALKTRISWIHPKNDSSESLDNDSRNRSTTLLYGTSCDSSFPEKNDLDVYM